MKWKEATLSQLYEIAYHDSDCSPRYKLAALEEIDRRQQSKSHTNITQTRIRRKRA